MSVRYHCSHLADPAPPLPPSYASSSSSFNPLGELYFCEECDAVRCDLCCVSEIASYFCPNCTFDVPSANVRGDKNRCARSCFSCPDCTTPLQVQATGTTEDAGPSAPSGPPFILICPCCRWSSREVALEFEKSAGLALQLQKLLSAKDPAQPEFDALKDHLDTYITSPAPAPTPARSASKHPTRHISHLTQMAAKALHRDVPGMAAAGAVAKSGLRREMKGGGERYGWDELGEYGTKESWRARGLERGDEDVEAMRRLGGIRMGVEPEGSSWYNDGKRYPERIPLQTKLTKRCPHPACRHLLIQPDTKSTRFKIKMVAANYLPVVEIGRRRRRIDGGGHGLMSTGSMEEAEVRRKERRRLRGRGEEVDEDMGAPIRPGEVYTFQIAFTNPLYDPIQVRLTQPTAPLPALLPANHLIHIPTRDFIVNPLKDAWSYDDEEEYADMEGTEMGTSEDGSSVLPSSRGTLGPAAGKRSRLSVLATSSGGTLRDKERRKRESEVDKKGNCTKVGVEVEILPGATGEVVFDLEVRFTYRVHDTDGSKPKGAEKETQKGKEEYKHFTFWARVDLGCISP